MFYAPGRFLPGCFFCCNPGSICDLLRKSANRTGWKSRNLHGMGDGMKFELIKSENTYKGRAFSVRRDHLLTPSGTTVKYDIIEHIGSVSLVPVDEDGQIYFVRQYRHAAQVDLLELPAGTLEPGEPPLEAAAREIREEIGMAASSLLE